MQNYATKILQDEVKRIETVLKDTSAFTNYPEAYKDRQRKIKELKQAIEKNEQRQIIIIYICNYSNYTNLFSKYLIMSEAEYNSLTIVELHALAEEIRIKLSYDPKKTEREKLMVKLATIELNIDQRFLDL